MAAVTAETIWKLKF